jgi:glycosyltransferase involved in cell wall biosynthesis
VPNRNSPYTAQTIQDLLDNARGDVEVICHVDEKFPEPRIRDRRVTYLTHDGEPRGMRAGINAAAKAATGEFLMKCDDHCAFAPGYDLALERAHAEDNWVQVPRRYSLDVDKWRRDLSRPHRDYLYLCYPQKGKKHDDGMHGSEWYERQRERAHGHDIDETPSMQGSCYFMTKHYFDKVLRGLSEVGYGRFAQEAQEVGMKTWLGGGALKVNKHTWYAHWHKGKNGRQYKFDNAESVRGINWSAWYWMTDQWAGRVHDIAWFVDEKFSGMPTWPADWKERWYVDALVPVGA